MIFDDVEKGAGNLVENFTIRGKCEANISARNTKNTNRHRNVGDDAISINGDREEFVIIILKTYFRFLLYRSIYAPHPPPSRSDETFR